MRYPVTDWLIAAEALVMVAYAALERRLWFRLDRSGEAGIEAVDGTSGTATPVAAQVALAIRRVQRRLPVQFNCLSLALAAERMLRRRGQPALVVIGVDRRAGEFRSHAWATSAGSNVVGAERADAFRPIWVRHSDAVVR